MRLKLMRFELTRLRLKYTREYKSQYAREAVPKKACEKCQRQIIPALDIKTYSQYLHFIKKSVDARLLVQQRILVHSPIHHEWYRPTRLLLACLRSLFALVLIRLIDRYSERLG